MADLGQLADVLRQTQSSAGPVRKQAEQTLGQLEGQPGFPQQLMALIRDPAIGMDAKLSGAVYLKNFVRRNWRVTPDGAAGSVDAGRRADGAAGAGATSDAAAFSNVDDSDRAAIKAQIVDVMLTSPRAILLQMSDTVAIIANADFPHAWETLVPELVSKLAMDDMARNLGILETAATIFGRWRGMTRSNALFTEIKLVLDQWCPSYLELFRVIDAGIDQHATQWAQLEPRLAALDLMFKIYYSLNCQDLPEFFEDHLAEFCGFFGKYLQYQNPVVEQAADPATPGVLERIQETICEIVHMYGTRYESDFPQLPEFVRLIWNLLTTRSLDPRFDVLTSKAMGFLAGVARPPRHRALFEAPETLQSILEKIAIPNMQLREADQELFEDDPLQYVRRDLEGNDTETRRRAAADLVRALLEHFCEPISAMAIQYYNTFLAHYAQDKAQFWLHKNTALYLIVSVSAKNIVNSRVVDLNPKIQIGEIFAQSILPELQEAAGAMGVGDGGTIASSTPAAGSLIHPIVVADALRFYLLFQAQFTKADHLRLLPLLVQFLGHEAHVVSAWAVLCLEKLITSAILDSADDWRQAAPHLLDVVFRAIHSQGQTPEKIAANEFYMRFLMRVMRLFDSDGAFMASVAQTLLQQLTQLISLTAQNPSNPKFNHFLWEVLAQTVKSLCRADPGMVANCETFLFPPLQAILQNDVSDYLPYVFQVMGLMLSQHPKSEGIPPAYQTMLQPLLTPLLWESRGNIPALVRLLRVYLDHGNYTDEKRIEPYFGICHKLLASRLNDDYGYELLGSILELVSDDITQGYLRAVLMLLLTRLMNSRTPKFSNHFIRFLCLLVCLHDRPRLTPQFVVDAFEAIQPGLLANVLQTIVVPSLEHACATVSDVQRIVTGMTRLLTETDMLTRGDAYRIAWPGLLNTLLTILETPVGILSSSGAADAAAAATTAAPGLAQHTMLDDMEEGGFQATVGFNRLSSLPVPQPRLLSATVRDPKAYLAHGLQQLSARYPGQVDAMVASQDPATGEILAKYLQRT